MKQMILNAFLPSVFASAGIITLFAATLGARQLYGLIGAEIAFGGLVAIAATAVFIGWHYGALLTLNWFDGCGCRTLCCWW